MVPNEDVEYSTAFALIRIPARSVVLVRISEDVVNLYTMCTGRENVTVSFDNHTLTLAAGHEVSLRKSTSAPITPIAIRGPHEVQVNDYVAEVGEFSIPNALAKGGLYQQLARGDNAHRDLLNRIMKSAVSLHTVTYNRGNYTR